MSNLQTRGQPPTAVHPRTLALRRGTTLGRVPAGMSSNQLIALRELRRIIQNGHAGVDQHDPEVFVVRTISRNQRAIAETVLGNLRAVFLRRLDTKHVRILLPGWVRADLRLDTLDRPTLATRRTSLL